MFKKDCISMLRHPRAPIAAFVLMVTFLCFSMASHANAQATNLVFNQTFVGIGTAHSYKIATLPAQGSGTYDHLHFVATTGWDYVSYSKASLDVLCSNRGGLNCTYTEKGSSYYPAGSYLAAFVNVDSSVDIWFIFTSAYNAGSYTILENLQETVYPSPVQDMGAAYPTTTPAWSTIANVPAVYSDWGGNVGVGTTSPSSRIGTTGGLNVDAEDDNAGTPFPDGGYSVLGISFGTASGEGIGSARVAGSPNFYGLDFFTQFQNRLSITSDGNVGIGTTTPTQMLEVNGNAQIDGNLTANGITFPNGSTLTAALAANFASNNGNLGIGMTGNVGIGTSIPNQKLEVANGNVRIWNNSGLTFPYSALTQNSYIEFTQELYDNTADPGGLARIGVYSNGQTSIDNYGQAGGLFFQTSDRDSAPTTKMVVDRVGNVGIGTTTPGAKLEVNGNVKLTSGSGAFITFSDTTVQSTAWNGTTLGGDYAESVDVTGDRTHYEPGDVIVIDGDVTGKFDKSNTSYSRRVAGVYSTKPGLVGRRTTADRPDKEAEVPMAMMGIVPTKVSTENGPIERGDLLVSSSTPGYAMKGTDHDRLTGAIIGKALAPLKSGSGVIEVLLALQ